MDPTVIDGPTFESTFEGDRIRVSIIQKSKGGILFDLILGRSLFTQKIQEELIQANFYLILLETFVNSVNPMEYFIAFCTQILLYDTSNALICCTFPTMLRDPKRE